MAVALATMVVLNKNGRRQSVSTYLNDTTNNLARFDESKIAVAASPDSFTMKDPGAIIDICLTSDLATPTHLQILRNGTPTGDILDCTAQLASVVNRPNPNVFFNQGDKIQISQLA